MPGETTKAGFQVGTERVSHCGAFIQHVCCKHPTHTPGADSGTAAQLEGTVAPVVPLSAATFELCMF